MSKNDFKKNDWERKNTPVKMRNVTSVPTRKKTSDDPVKLGWIEKVMAFYSSAKSYILKVIGVFAAVGAVYGVYQIGMVHGVAETEEKQPEIIKRLEAEKDYATDLRTAVEKENLGLKNELEDIQKEYGELQESFDALSSLQTKESSEGSELISDPAETKIDEQKSAVFFDSLNVSIVDINTDKSPYITEVTVSVNNEVQETYPGLKVGDKKIYKNKDITYEVLITSVSVVDVGVTVFKYQEN